MGIALFVNTSAVMEIIEFQLENAQLTVHMHTQERLHHVSAYPHTIYIYIYIATGLGVLQKIRCG